MITFTELTPGHNRAVCANKPFEDESLQTAFPVHARLLTCSFSCSLVLCRLASRLHDLSSLRRKKRGGRGGDAQKCSSLQDVNHRHEILDESL